MMLLSDRNDVISQGFSEAFNYDDLHRVENRKIELCWKQGLQ